jgi:hypothetical protein
VQLGVGAGLPHPSKVGHKGDSAGTSMGSASQAPRHHRAKSIRADCETGPNGVPFTAGVPHQDAGYSSRIVEQLFDPTPFHYVGAHSTSCRYQLLVENSSGNSKSGGTKRSNGSAVKNTMEPCPVSRCDFGPPRLCRTSALQRLDHAEFVEHPDRFGAHVFSAGFVARETGPVHREDRNAGPGQESGQAASGRSGSGHEDVYFVRVVSQANARAPGRPIPRSQ